VYKYMFLAIFPVLASCGGGGGSSNSGGSTPTPTPTPEPEQGVTNCVVMMNVINLASGEACNFTKEDADQYSLTEGEVSCEAGTLTYGGGQYTSGAGSIVFNGLTFSCASS